MTRLTLEKKKSSASPGRPAGKNAAQVRTALLQAARQQFLAREFHAVSLRSIAQAAGVNSAMVNYYFGSKTGLYLTMADELLAEFDQALSRLEQDEGADVLAITAITNAYHRLILKNPWWPNFIIREIMFGSGETKDAMMERVASVLAPRFIKTMQDNIDSGVLRDDLDPQLALVSIMGLTLFPFIVQPVIERVMGVDVDETKAEQMIQHNSHLFLHGALAKP